VYADDGKTLITMFYDQNRRDVPLADIGTVMQQAIVAAEDTRFYQRGGVDFKGLVRAMVANVRGGRTEQGASTLTMQYVRNVLKNDSALTPEQRAAATVDTPGRKLQEIRYATALEKRLSRQDILDRYLNIAYFGDGAYGIDAASQHYFAEPPSRLTLPEAALLAGLVQSPDADNPITGDQTAALGRRTYVLDAMAKMGVISTADADTAKTTPLVLHPSTLPNDCASVSHNDWGFFCDYLRQWWDAQPSFGATGRTGSGRSRKAATRSSRRSTRPYRRPRSRSRSACTGTTRRAPCRSRWCRPGTGHVEAMAVNRHYSLTPNRAAGNTRTPVDQLIAGGGGVTGYQAGSTFKMFTMLAALTSGHPLATAFDAPSALPTHWRDNGPGNCGGYWCPANANPTWMDGQRTMWTGFGRSVNTYFVWLEEQIGPQDAVAMAQRLGITFRAKSDADLAAHPDGWGSFTLGVADTTPLDLASAYATVAARGTYCEPLPVLSITDPAGHAVSAANPTCHQAIAPDVAAAATGRRPVPGRPAVFLRPMRRRYRAAGRVDLRRPPGRREDRQFGEQRDGDVRRLHPAVGRRGYRRRSGQPARPRRQRRRGAGRHRRRHDAVQRGARPAVPRFPEAERAARVRQLKVSARIPGSGRCPAPASLPGQTRSDGISRNRHRAARIPGGPLSEHPTPQRWRRRAAAGAAMIASVAASRRPSGLRAAARRRLARSPAPSTVTRTPTSCAGWPRTRTTRAPRSSATASAASRRAGGSRTTTRTRSPRRCRPTSTARTPRTSCHWPSPT
jgi:hypothetical protein